MRLTYKQNIQKLHDENFSASELALMYQTSVYQINLILEEEL